MKLRPAFIAALFSLALKSLVPTAVSAQTQSPTVAPPTPAMLSAPRPPAPPQDWPNLHRYREANAALPAPSAPDQRVVFMGDSITDNWGRGAATGPFFPGEPYINRGISGQTTPQMLIRFQQDVVHLKPTVVVINAGTNDIAGNTGPSTPEMIEDNLTSMTQIAQANAIHVVLSSITPAYDYPWHPKSFPTATILAVNQWMQTFCTTHHCTYLDYYTPMADPKGAMLPGYSSDGVHPLAKGYAVMAPLAEQAIAAAKSMNP
jgi:lysophospholipase L1-like esterase